MKIAKVSMITAALCLAVVCTNVAVADVSMADSYFLQKAANAGNYEVKGSHLALDKTKNPDVQAFAQHMIDEHTKASEVLKVLADKKKVKVSGEPSFLQKGALLVLERKSGKGFDKKYVENIGLDAHEDAIKLFENAAKSADDPEIKAFANNALPTLNHHLEMAQTLDSVVKNKAK